jgi:hypothetical protein
MEPEVEKLVFSICGSSSSVESSSSCTDSDSAKDLECLMSDTDNALHGIEKLDQIISLPLQQDGEIRAEERRTNSREFVNVVYLYST